ncbi:hypothetical protein ACLK2F_00845 [Escherichia coli]
MLRTAGRLPIALLIAVGKMGLQLANGMGAMLDADDAPAATNG